MEAHASSFAYHSGRSVSDLATEAMMNFTNWPLGVLAVLSLRAISDSLSRESPRAPAVREPLLSGQRGRFARVVNRTGLS